MPDLFVLPLIPNIFPCFEGGTNLFLGNLLIYVKMFGLRQEFSVRFVLFSLPVLLKLATIIIHWHEYFFNLMSSTNGTHFSWLLSITIESISSFLSTYSSLNIFFIHCFRFGIVFFPNHRQFLFKKNFYLRQNTTFNWHRLFHGQPLQLPSSASWKILL